MDYAVTRQNDELYHYGIKGMKWGVRRAKQQTAVSLAKANYKNAKKDYNKSYDRALKYSKRHMIRQFTDKKAESDRLRNEAIDAAEKSKSARQEYKDAKKANKKPMSTAKKAAIGAAATAAIIGGAYGAYKLSKYIKSEAGKRSYESGKKYAQEHFFSKADINKPSEYLSLQQAGRKTLQNTDKRTKKVSNSTLEAIKYLRHPERYQVDGDLYDNLIRGK